MAKKTGKKKGSRKKQPTTVPGTGQMPDVLVKKFFRKYEDNCKKTETFMPPVVKSTLKVCAENLQLFPKIILEPLDDIISSEGKIISRHVSLEPLLYAMKSERYLWLKALYVWEIPIFYDTVSLLASVLEKQVYEFQLIELMSCLLDATCIQRLSRSFNFAPSLTTLSFDYNEFGDEGCTHLCNGLAENAILLSLSLRYCNLTEKSGSPLGRILSSTRLRSLYLDGNRLSCQGIEFLIESCLNQARKEHFDREEEKRRKIKEEEDRIAELALASKYRGKTDSPTSVSKKEKSSGKSKKKRKKKSSVAAPILPGPWVHKLHLADNEIDVFTPGRDVASISCCVKLRELVATSICLEEIDLDENLIGEISARELLEGLEERKECGLPDMKLRTTPRMTCETFDALVKLGGGLKKKKRKLKGKKKK